jgi:rod shape determining protein RodA
MKKNSLINKVDFVFLVPVLLIIISGLLAIYSSSYLVEMSRTGDLFYKQVIWVCLGLIVMFVIIFIPMRFVYALGYQLYVLSIILLIIVLFTSGHSSGTSRWIRIFGFQFQPSEFAKIATIIALSKFLSESKISENNIKDMIISFMIILIPMVLIREQPDLGTSLVFAAFLLPMLFWADLPLFSLFVIVAPFVSLIAISLSSSKNYILIIWLIMLTLVLYLAKKGLWVAIYNYMLNLSVVLIAPYFWNKLKPYQQERIKNF